MRFSRQFRPYFLEKEGIFRNRVSRRYADAKWLVAPVLEEDDSTVVELPSGRWRDDLGEEHAGPKRLILECVPQERLPRFERILGEDEGR